MVATTVAPPPNSSPVTAAAMEFGEAPVTTATSLAYGSALVSSAWAASSSRPQCFAWRATASPAPVTSTSLASRTPTATRAISSRADAQRSSNSTALLASNAVATRRGQSEPSSWATTSKMAASASLSSRLTVRCGSRPSCCRIVRAVSASTPALPVTCSAYSPSAAESTTPPEPPAPPDGNATDTPWFAAT